jgi:DNA-binding CsgD family transcriptional regulator
VAAHLEDYIGKSQSATSLKELGAICLTAVRSEGYESIAFFKATPGRVESIRINNYPDAYRAYYKDQHFERIDPIIATAVRSQQPFYWSELSRSHALTARQAAFLAELEACGFHSGLTLPFHGPGSSVEILGMCRAQPGPESRSRLAHIYAIGVQTWQMSLKFTQAAPPRIPMLSPRELECLKWSKEGKSYADIGDILGISDRTVEYHISNALRKLEAPDRITAIVRAIHYGIL